MVPHSVFAGSGSLCAARALALNLDGNYLKCRHSALRINPFGGLFSNVRSQSTSRDLMFNVMKHKFKTMDINRVFVLEKITKYDLEIRNGLKDDEIRARFPLAYKTHMTHMKLMESLVRQLKERFHLHTIVVKAQSHNLSLIDMKRSAFPPDIVISAGGDGTFLEAASLIPPTELHGKPLWVAGINTDPERSRGALLLSYFNRGNSLFDNPYRLCKDNNNKNVYEARKQKMIRFKETSAEISRESTSETIGEKEWSDITSASFSGMKPLVDTSAPDQCTVISRLATSIYNLTYDEYIGSLLDRLLIKRDCNPVCRQKIRLKIFKRQEPSCLDDYSSTRDSSNIEQSLFSSSPCYFNRDELEGEVTLNGQCRLPCGAVNDVMIADKFFGKTFYALIQVDNSPIMPVKSSGVLVTTGTGSTAWAYNVCKVSVAKGMQLFNKLLSHPGIPKDVSNMVNQDMIREAIEAHNNDLIYEASCNMMKCIIREGIGDIASAESSSFKGKLIKLLSLSKTAQILIDGSKTISMDYGDVVVLKTFESDVIWSCV